MGQELCLSTSLASLACPSLETTLDCRDGSGGPAGLACHEDDSILLCQERLWRATCAAGNVLDCFKTTRLARYSDLSEDVDALTDVMPQNLLNLNRLETTLDD